MSALEIALYFVFGFIASGINTVAGGGSLISFPGMTLGMGIDSQVANATNAVGLFPGSFAGGIGLRKQLGRTGAYFWPLFIPTVVGSIVGAFLLVVSSEKLFNNLVPFLILLAACTLLFQPKVKAYLAKRDHATLPMSVGYVLQFFVAIYGGYFGAGMGIMMLAAFSLYMEGTTHELNAVKGFLGGFINLAGSVVFLIKGVVMVPAAVVFGLGSIVGGLLAAKVSQKFDPDKLRLVIAAYGIAMAAYYFYKVTLAQ
ncbi:MAG TPA: sulfite exporter TauE/SafE family protein [Fimbriimonas sp.]|nr:sulfite exporter TauE/SafE family protein [Fimbriimonas sp.]